MTRRKFWALLLSAVMIAGFLSACGNTGENEDSAKAGDDSGEVVLTLMGVGGSNEQEFTGVVQAAADRFNEDNAYNARIELEWYENEQYKTKLATLMTQNDATDIFYTWEAGFMKDYVESGKVFSLSDALTADSEWMERFNDGALDSVTFDDKVYAVPMGQAFAPVYYNKAIFAENGVEVPTTWEELLDAVKTFKDAGIVPMSMACQDAWVAGQLMLELSGGIGGKELFDDIVSGAASWDDPRYVETGKAFQELVNAGAFQESFLGLAYEEGRTLFTSGKAAMYPMGTWETAAVVDEMGGSENVGVFLLPPKNPDCTGTHLYAVDKVFAISEKCENKDAALAFLKILSDPEIQEKLVVDCNLLPATGISVDETKVDPINVRIIGLQSEITGALTPMDRQFGANVGGEFNNISLAIAGGKDPQEQFTALKDYAAQEAEQ